MKKRPLTSTLGRLVVAALLFAVSAGFTVAHHACQMEGMRCCDAMESGRAMRGPAPSHEPTIHQQKAECCVTTLSGGLSGLSALLEKQTELARERAAGMISAAELFTVVPAPHGAVGSLAVHEERTAPPPVEKYVLFASFLI